MAKYYNSSSKGEILISGMQTRHIYFAMKKLKRSVFISETDDGHRLTIRGEDTKEYKDLKEELAKRPTQDYLTPIYKYK